MEPDEGPSLVTILDGLKIKYQLLPAEENQLTFHYLRDGTWVRAGFPIRAEKKVTDFNRAIILAKVLDL